MWVSRFLHQLLSSCQEESLLFSIPGSLDTLQPRTMRYLFLVFENRLAGFVIWNEIILFVQLYAVQFHLFVTCVLFLSREGFRRACMRADIKWFASLVTFAYFLFYFRLVWEKYLNREVDCWILQPMHSLLHGFRWLSNTFIS